MVDKVAGIILAAGKSIRMNSDQPKVLHKVCGKPILSYVIEATRTCGAKPIYVVIGYEGKKVKQTLKDNSICWTYQTEQRGTANALAMTTSSLADFEGTILVVCGDIPLITSQTLQELIHTHQTNKDTACTILSCRLNNPSGYGRIVRNLTHKPYVRGQVTAIIEETETNEKEKEIKEINSGIYAFNPRSVYPVLKEIEPNPKSGEYYLTDVISLLVKKGERIEVCLTENADECWGVNSQEQLTEVNRLMEQRIQHTFLKEGVTIIDPAKTYIESDVTIGPDTIIYPFTVIRTGVRIGRHCEVGPFSHLRKGTVLEDYAEVGNFTETKKTKLGQHTKAKHLSYLGDTLIGNDVNIGAGTITANFDGKRKHQTIIENGASTGSGTVLIAPVRMGKKAITGAGCVVPKGKNVPPSTTVVGMPAKPLSSSNATKKRRSRFTSGGKTPRKSNRK